MIEKKDKRNSLIELYRFFFALVVVKSHSLFPYNGKYFGPGGIAVEFFFIVSGYLFMRSLKKWQDMPLWKGLPKMLLSKIKPIAIPLGLGLVSNLLYIWTVGEKGFWGYLWYVRVMLVCFAVYFVLARWIKNRKAFFAVTLGICLICSYVRFGLGEYAFSYTRGGSALSIGILLSYLPPLQSKKKWWLWCVVAVLQAITFVVVANQWSLVSVNGVNAVEAVMVFMLYPALVYFTFQISFQNKVLNYLGALSFGLYAFQCPADLLRGWGVNDVYILFVFIVLASVLEDAGKRLWRLRKKRKEKSLCIFYTN